ncbi:MAG: hypothetical protein HC828_12450 [Blastochloris sp.]|nr:hypothetical protein [Blastochloris sp.]
MDPSPCRRGLEVDCYQADHIDAGEVIAVGSACAGERHIGKATGGDTLDAGETDHGNVGVVFVRADDVNAPPQGESVVEDTLFIAPPADLLDQFYGNNAPARIVRVEAEVQLVTFYPPLLIDNRVSFGLLLQPAADASSRAGIEVQVQEQGLINVGQRMGDAVSMVSQRSVGAVNLRLRLERDLDDGTIVLFLNNEQVARRLRSSMQQLPVRAHAVYHAGGRDRPRHRLDGHAALKTHQELEENSIIKEALRIIRCRFIIEA